MKTKTEKSPLISADFNRRLYLITRKGKLVGYCAAGSADDAIIKLKPESNEKVFVQVGSAPVIFINGKVAL